MGGAGLGRFLDQLAAGFDALEGQVGPVALLVAKSARL